MPKKKKKRQERTYAPAVTTAVFLAIILGFGAAGILSPDREFSQMENRSLQQAPEFSFERLKNGSYTADIEKYMSDQVFLKDQLVSLRTTADRALMKSYLNGVYFGDDGYYLQDFQFNEELFKKNLGLINEFAAKAKIGKENAARVSFLLAPNSIAVLDDKLPLFTQTDSQADAAALALESIDSTAIDNFICPLEQMRQSDKRDYFYYRTDHHWTDDGARFAFNGLMETLGREPVEESKEFIQLDNFYGTLYSKAPQSSAMSDTVYLPDGIGDITVKYISKSGDHALPAECEELNGIPTKSGLYAAAPMETKDKYAAIMGGNFALCEIETSADNDDSVLILKDSYANAVLPYLCQRYRHISLIDLRYYHMEEKTVSEYAADKGIKDIIFIYNIDFLNSDNNFVWLE